MRRHLIVVAVALAGAFAVLAPTSAQAQSPGFRFGLHLGGGGFLGDVEGGMGGGDIQLGLKISDELSVYYQGHALIGAFSRPDVDSVAFINWNTIALELGDEPLRFAIGPSLDFVAGCSAQGDDVACGDGGPYLGANARVAVWLRGLTIAADVHPTFYGSGYTSWAGVLSLGFQN